MKILQLTPRPVFPPDDGGRISIANITRYLREAGADIHMITLDDSQPSSSLGAIPVAEEVESGGGIIKLYRIGHSTANTLPRLLRSVIDAEPLYLRKHNSASIRSYLDTLLATEKFDLVHADHTAMAPLGVYIKQHYGLPLGLRLHNVEWRIWQRYADELPSWHPKHWYIQSQALKLRKREAELIAQADVAFAITDVDAEEARKMMAGVKPKQATPTRIVSVGAGVSPEEWLPPADNKRNAHELILATVWSWVHNLNGARWFIDEVLPLVRNDIPDAQLRLLGKNAPPELFALRDKGVYCEGYVPSVQPYYHRAAVFIAPLFVGSGVRIKILEAMAAGLPVVATPVAAEGIPATEEQGLFVASDAQDFAFKVKQLLASPETAERAGAKAAAFVARYYSWREKVRVIEQEYKKLLKL